MTLDKDDKEYLVLLLTPIKSDLKTLSEATFGNGQPGIKSKVERHEVIIKGVLWISGTTLVLILGAVVTALGGLVHVTIK